MGWFGFGRRKPAGEDSPTSPIPSVDGEKSSAAEALSPKQMPDASEALQRDARGSGNSVEMKEQAQASNAAGAAAPTMAAPFSGNADVESAFLPPAEEQEQGIGARLKTAVLDCVSTAERAPETLEEAMAVLRGERAFKPNYQGAAYTVAVSFGGGCVHGLMQGGTLASKFPRHQRNAVRLRTGVGMGLRYATFALIFEGSCAIMEALRKKRDVVGGTVGGALAGTAYGVPGGLASARTGLFYGIWVGGMFGMFRNHLAHVREEARLAEEERRLEEEERDADGKLALQRAIAGIKAQLDSWPTATEEPEEAEEKPASPRRQNK